VAARQEHDVRRAHRKARRAVEGWVLIVSALGLAMALEGLPWFVSPTAAREALARLSRLPDAALRSLGFGLMAGGLLLAWIALH
jgi:uncharacterized protein YjeT (DUF2065 family)